MIYIYCLKDPSDNIRYIGKTNNLKTRLANHIREAKSGNNRRYVLNWIKSLLDTKQTPTIHEIERCNESNWQERERYWVAYYKQLIPNLCNNANGGLGGSGKKNYTKFELDERKLAMSKRMSKFSEVEKIDIWNLICNGNSFEFIYNLYPYYSRQMDFGVRHGRQWNLITGLPKTQILHKRKGYTFQRGLYMVRDKFRKRIFSSKSEQAVKDYLEMDRQ